MRWLLAPRAWAIFRTFRLATPGLALSHAADILPHEQIHVWDVTNGARLETYIIEGERGSGVLGINGAAAHLIGVGDVVILIAYQSMADDEARSFRPRVVHVDANPCNLGKVMPALPTLPATIARASACVKAMIA